MPELFFLLFFFVGLCMRLCISSEIYLAVYILLYVRLQLWLSLKSVQFVTEHSLYHLSCLGDIFVICFDRIYRCTAFALLHFVLQGQICLLLQVFLDFLLLHCRPLWWKGHLFWVLVLEGLVGLHRIIQLQLLQHYWLGHRLGLLWYWMICLGNEQRSFCRLWDCIQVLHFRLLLTMMATPFLLWDSCPQ